MDHTKFGKVLPYTFAELEDIDGIITDIDLDDELKEKFKNMNIKIY